MPRRRQTDYKRGDDANDAVIKTLVAVNSLNDAQEDGLDVCQNSIHDAHDFIHNILSKLNIKPSYMDLHPDGKIAFMWHIHEKAILGISFDGCGKIIWNYYLKEENIKNHGTMLMLDFLSSDVSKILKENFT